MNPTEERISQLANSPDGSVDQHIAERIFQLIDELDSYVDQLLAERDDARAALRQIRDHITEATAYPETVAWVRRVIDAVLPPA